MSFVDMCIFLRNTDIICKSFVAIFTHINFLWFINKACSFIFLQCMLTANHYYPPNAPSQIWEFDVSNQPKAYISRPSGRLRTNFDHLDVIEAISHQRMSTRQCLLQQTVTIAARLRIHV